MIQPPSEVVKFCSAKVTFVDGQIQRSPCGMVKIRNPINNEIKRWIRSFFLRMIFFLSASIKSFLTAFLVDLEVIYIYIERERYNKSHGTGPKKTGELHGEFSCLG